MAREMVLEQTAKLTASKKQGRAEEGVTLLELLVSITIVALLAATALFAWRVGVSAWEKADAQLGKDRHVLAAHQLLQEQIASMVPYEARAERRGRAVFFQGEGETARFVSRYSLANRAASGLYLIEYHVAEQPGGTPSTSLLSSRTGGVRAGKQLLLRETPVRGSEELGARIADIESDPEGFRLRLPAFERDAETVVLLEGLQECRFEYFRLTPNAQPEGDLGNWTDEWVSRGNELPSAMRIHAVSSEDSGDLRPVTIVAAIRNFTWQPPPRSQGVQGILEMLGIRGR
jgi:prepilin-type N-terminal cleavage/methylation domain-containing protein